jgi:uncharacterized protein YlxP (DUF503 family)
MVIGVVTVDISIPHAQSLKDKRAVIRSVKDRLVSRMNVSAAEVGKQDVWKYAELAFVTVAANATIVQRRLSTLSEALRSDPRYVLIRLNTEML